MNSREQSGAAQGHARGGQASHGFAEYGDEDFEREIAVRGNDLTDADDQALRDTLGHLNERKPTLDRARGGFLRASGSNPFQAEQNIMRGANHGREMALIDLSKVPQQSQPAHADRPPLYDMRDIHNDALGDTMAANGDDELLASRLPETGGGHSGGAADFRADGDGDTFAFDGNSGDFATGASNDLEGATGGFDLTTDPEFMKRQREELERYAKERENSAQNQPGSQRQDEND